MSEAYFPSTIHCIWTAGEGVGFTLGATLVTLVLAVTGYTGSAAGAQVVQTPLALLGIVANFSVIPALTILLGLIPLARHPLRRDDIDKDGGAPSLIPGVPPPISAPPG